MEDLGLKSDFWNGKRVFLTGHTGFKGSWLSLWLQESGAILTGYALQPATSPNLFHLANVKEGMNSVIGDIRDFETLSETLKQAKPDIVFHLAAQAIVRQSYDEPIETYSTNVMGTVNLFEACRLCPSVQAIINVTSDKCYENKEWIWGYKETDVMGGHDPYSNSKGCSELVTSAYRKSFFQANQDQEQRVGLASARAGNVIGGGDWAKARLIPDILNAFEKEEPVIIRNPKAIRPWQHVLEPLSGYMALAEKLYDNSLDYAEGWNFGPRFEDTKSVEWIVGHLSEKWGGTASWYVDKNENPHEANLLRLDCTKVNEKLGWQPRWDLSIALDQIVLWQKAYQENADMRDFSVNQITEFSNWNNKND